MSNLHQLRTSMLAAEQEVRLVITVQGIWIWARIRMNICNAQDFLSSLSWTWSVRSLERWSLQPPWCCSRNLRGLTNSSRGWHSLLATCRRWGKWFDHVTKSLKQEREAWVLGKHWSSFCCAIGTILADCPAIVFTNWNSLVPDFYRFQSTGTLCSERKKIVWLLSGK